MEAAKKPSVPNWDERLILPRYHPNSREMRALDAPVTVGLRPCLHGSSRANQTTPCRRAFSRWPVLSWQSKLVIFPFIADNFNTYITKRVKKQEGNPRVPISLKCGRFQLWPFHQALNIAVMYDKIKKTINKNLKGRYQHGYHADFL